MTEKLAPRRVKVVDPALLVTSFPTASVDFCALGPKSTNRSHPWTARVECRPLYQAIITKSRGMTCAPAAGLLLEPAACLRLLSLC